MSEQNVFIVYLYTYLSLCVCARLFLSSPRRFTKIKRQRLRAEHLSRGVHPRHHLGDDEGDGHGVQSLIERLYHLLSVPEERVHGEDDEER